MIKNRILIERRRFRDFYAKLQLKRHPKLWAGLNRYLSETKSTGCSYIDYWYLFDHVKRKAPIEILECGTGVTTLVLAYALEELEQEGRMKNICKCQRTFCQWSYRNMLIFA